MSDFNEDDDDFEPVFRNRHRERPHMLEGRVKGPLRDSRFVTTLLDQLDLLEKNTRPSSGSEARGKDLAAFEALEKAAWLVHHIAGWAVDHQRGLAQKGLQFVPLVPSQTKSSPEYLERLTAVDDHDHERRGSVRSELSPIEARQLVLNVLRPMSGHLRLPSEFIEALEALQFGETLPILQKKATTKRTGLVEFRAKLTAIAYIEYQYVKGVKKYASTEVVADKFAVSRDAVKDWPVEVRSALGNLEVQRRISTAQNSARNYMAEMKEPEAWANEMLEYYEESYGLPALLEAAARYKRRAAKA